jgi:hypothetical protein
VVDIEVMPTPDGLSQELFLIVRREIAGVERHFVEAMEQPFIDLDGSEVRAEDAWHQFCGVKWQGPATNVLPGPAHLEGARVTAWTDQGALTDLVVQDGVIHIPGNPVTSAIIGLDFTDRQFLETLEIAPGAADGGSDGRVRTVRAVAARLHRTADGFVETVRLEDGKETTSPSQRLIEFPLFGDLDLHDMVVDVRGQKQSALQAFLRFRPAPGAPMTVLSRTPTLMTSDS